MGSELRIVYVVTCVEPVYIQRVLFVLVVLLVLVFR